MFLSVFTNFDVIVDFSNCLFYPRIGMNKINKLKIEAITLRKSGKSYSEINCKTGVPKSTLSTWFSNEEWSKKISKKLNKKWAKVNVNRLVKINMSRKLETIKRHEFFKDQAKKEFNVLKNDHLFLVGLSIYWGEGSKQFNGRVGVINSDLSLLQIVTRFFIETLQIPERKLRGELFIYEDHDKNDSLNFWSRELKIPKNQFIKTQQLKSRSKLTKRKLKYGICNVYFSSTEMNIKIRHWMKMLANEMCI